MKRLATNIHGEITYCTSPEEKIGQGRCNHVSHQKDGESASEYINRATRETAERDIDKKFIITPILDNSKDSSYKILIEDRETGEVDYYIEMYKDAKNDKFQGAFNYFNKLSRDLGFYKGRDKGKDIIEYLDKDSIIDIKEVLEKE